METAVACVVNIGPRGQRRRAIWGIVALGVGLAAMGLLLALPVPRLWRLALFLPLFAGATGIFQAREKT